ncbi:MAG: hypothetical protein AAGJ46_21185 [Planctomycetota bacterium]
MLVLTKRQQETLQAIKRVADRPGKFNWNALGAELGWQFVVARAHALELKRKGYVDWKRSHPSTIRVLQDYDPLKAKRPPRKPQPPRPLTRRQSTILGVIRAYQADHGYSPTLRDIGRRMGISSPNGVRCHLNALQTKGAIEWDPGRARTIRLVEAAAGEVG